MQPIEGLTPEVLWYTLVGLAGIGALIILVDKVADVFRRRKARRSVESTPTDALAEAVGRKLLDPRLDDVDRKLANDKVRIDDHALWLARHTEQISAIEESQKVLCRGILALLSHEINGNSDDKLRASQQEITNYLIDK